MPEEIKWRFLVVDDKQADETAEFIAENRVLDLPNKIIVEKCQKFADALDILVRLRIDLVILDLKDDSIILEDDDKPLAGEIVFEKICQTRFIPIIFYTAYPQKVQYLENPYIRVVTRGDDRKLRAVIKEIFETGLPSLIRHLDEEQRIYMWDHLQTYWKDKVITSSYKKTDLAYLLARRLAQKLERNSIRRFLAGQQDIGPNENDTKIHPIEMYIYPPDDTAILAGDIIKGISPENEAYWIVLTPSCDFEHNHAKKVLLAECIQLETQPEYVAVLREWEETRKAEKSKLATRPKKEYETIIKELIRDNRKGHQRDRYKFLPGTFFLPNLLIDYQSIIQIPLELINKFKRITSLDNPFAEACIAKFSRYYGRLGMPDLDVDFVYERLYKNWISMADKD